MHDPLTQAFNFGRWLTIWHCDPLKFINGTTYRRDDDSCGWFTPPYSKDQKEKIEKLANEQFREIFSKLVAIEEGKSYAYICNEPNCYDAIYWSWRAIKHLYKPDTTWQYGTKLTSSELEHIYSLATNPVDNLQVSFTQIKDSETFTNFFFLVFTAYLRHSRPWYRHPKFHFWHWQFQFHHLQSFKRWAFSRCATCGKHFKFGYSPTTNTWDNTGPLWFRSEKDVHHSDCSVQGNLK